MDTLELLKSLCHAKGTSGSETDAAAVAADFLGKYMPVRRDALGNVIGETEAKGKRILLDAHLDEIGMVVTAVDEKGFVKFAKVGGIDPIVLSAAEVTVHGKKDVYGVITSTPPHLSKDDDKVSAVDELAIDIGMTESQAKELISLGDRITFNSRVEPLLGSRACGGAIDDRSGVASILLCLDILGERVKSLPITVLFSSGEETGGSGASVAAFSAQADEAIAVDVSFAKAPGVDESVTANLGEGTMIGFAPTLNHDMSSKLKSLAQQNDIKYQLEVMGGRTGTNADHICIAGCGTKMGLLSIPLRNMHTAVEIVDLADIEATAKLMAAYILDKEENENA